MPAARPEGLVPQGSQQLRFFTRPVVDLRSRRLLSSDTLLNGYSLFRSVHLLGGPRDRPFRLRLYGAPMVFDWELSTASVLSFMTQLTTLLIALCWLMYVTCLLRGAKKERGE